MISSKKNSKRLNLLYLESYLQIPNKKEETKKVLVHIRYLRFPAQRNCIFLCYDPYILAIHISILDEQDCILR